MAETVDLDTIRDVLENQITCNQAISDTGLAGHYGAEVGATLRACSRKAPLRCGRRRGCRGQ